MDSLDIEVLGLPRYLTFEVANEFICTADTIIVSRVALFLYKIEFREAGQTIQVFDLDEIMLESALIDFRLLQEGIQIIRRDIQ